MTRAALAIVVAAAAACSGAQTKPAAPVAFSDVWPSRVGAYEDVHANWTRSGRLLEDYDRVLDLHATFKSPEWRAAYVTRRVAAEQLTKSAASELAQTERAAAEEVYEVHLLVATYRYEEDDLSRGDNSIWRIVLVDAAGTEVRPTEINKDRRPFEVVKAYFPDLTEHHTPYIARFPKTLDLLGDSAKEIKLVMGSARGGVELVWTAR